MKSHSCRIALTMLFIVLLPLASLADRRNYVWTYQYQTMPAQATELEFYQTTNLKEIADAWEYRIEVEQGLTNRLDVSVYQIFTQPEGGSLHWNAVQFRSRYRIGEEGQYALDPLVYLEYQRNTDSHTANKLEVKVILAKTMGRTNLALNPVYELAFAPGSEHEIGLDAGVCYELTPAVSLGLESTTRAEFEDEETTVASYVGPTISFASGRWWYSIGGGFGISEESDDAKVRFLMGMGL